MKDPSHISTKDRLSQFSQISTFVYHILTVAQAGGLPEQRAKAIYYEILDAYSTLKGEAFWLFKDELIRLLVTPDKQFENEEQRKPPGRRPNATRRRA